LALITEIDLEFPETDHLLCQWHVNINVVKNCKKHFWTKEEWDRFYAAWQSLLNSRIDEEYNGNLEKLHMYPIEPIKYLESTWLVWKEKLVSCPRF
jgi:hypothetical protein